ncbi:16S rRNA (guanine(966)-N(2))-methyltransferase RsmD [Thermatribacter velox]|uniref:16S rRNA (Guanine(966)-N(2))-methyltransferase RsmD n=1 Tax=Thermatribacter velox TaxID=3039681 RepID=A0ABZ2Y859_9BACT
MGYLHIVGGRLKGRKILVPSGKAVRPMQGFLRKALFEILKFELEESVVYDIFSGSGALGIEALSRGAKKAYFLEKNPRVCRVIEKNLEICSLKEHSRVLCLDFLKLRKFPHLEERPSLTFVDPPFASNHLKTIEKLYNFRVVFGQSLIVIRYSRTKDSESGELPFFKVEDKREYGKNVVLIGHLKREEEVHGG